jgi:hypothetical protein
LVGVYGEVGVFD